MRKIAIVYTILFLIAWFHNSLWIWITGETQIPDVLNLILNTVFSAILAFILVLFVEWLKGSDIKFVDIEPLYTPEPDPKRKFIKIGIVIEERNIIRVSTLFKLPPYIHSLAALTITINHLPKPKYRAKWDLAPEPLEYPHLINQVLGFHGEYRKDNKESKPIEISGSIEGKDLGYARVEMIPMASQSENLGPGNSASTSILVKHKGETGFYIYDPEYYFDEARQTKNYCNFEQVYLRVEATSSLGKTVQYLSVLNPDSNLHNFKVKKITEENYKSKVKISDN